ncbi:MAG TPA: DUF2378 family protein [Myxococcus sp.]|jgi:uncharacterized protein (TIGR02265 family)|nr:DUF2378 family protein [Myxococcus sp.]
MGSTKDDLERRIALARPDDTVRGLIFNAVLALAGRQLGPEAAVRLREPLFTRSPVDFFSYPAVDFLRLIYSTADALTPRYGSHEEAMRAVGGAAVTGFFHSTVGQTLTRLIGQKDPKRLFANAPTAYSTLVSYGRREYSELGARRVRLHFQGDMQPVAFHEGVLGEALNAIGCRGQARGTPHALDEAEYLIGWE